MKIEITDKFRDKLKRQIQYISSDKPFAAKKFNQSIFRNLKKINEMPYKNRKSIFFEDENIRELVLNGYLVIYEIIPEEQKIVVFGFHKWKNQP